MVIATEQNFTGTIQKWQYLAEDDNWKDAGSGTTIHITPSFHAWEDRDILTLKYISLWKETEYTETFTISKQYDGQDNYSVYISSSQGNTFRNGIIDTTLSASLFKGGIDITDRIPDYNFRWTRISKNPEEDIIWNEAQHTGKTLEITSEDVLFKAVFDCEITISTF